MRNHQLVRARGFFGGDYTYSLQHHYRVLGSRLGPLHLHIRTDGFRNTVAFEGRYWQIDCGYYGGSQWKSLGVVKLVFNRNYTVSVYKDGQYLYNVRVYVCARPGCGFGPWAPTQRLVIPVSWGPDGIAISIAQFRSHYAV
jgi:hypothetical protein